MLGPLWPSIQPSKLCSPWEFTWNLPWVKLKDIKQPFHDFSIELQDYSVFVTECTYENKTQAVRNQTCPSANLSYVLSEVAPGSLTAGCDQHLSAQDGKHSLNPALPGHTNICLFVVMVSQWTSSSARCSPLSQQALGRARSTYTCSTDSYAGQAHTHTHTPFSGVNEGCHVIGAELWIQHRAHVQESIRLNAVTKARSYQNTAQGGSQILAAQAIQRCSSSDLKHHVTTSTYSVQTVYRGVKKLESIKTA